MGAPEIAVGTVVAENGDVVVRLVATREDGLQMGADLPASAARQLAGLLLLSADRAEAEDAEVTRAAKGLLRNYCKLEGIAPPLEDRLAACLAEAIDETLMTVRDTMNDRDVELRLGSFRKDISERAAELLEEAGR